mmetsp:Transcript_16328/g.33124  ORF Transcript_16328/g.33124 Transcript_16328/m.33124 type:complete len:100 (-) Transcript_16328:202-501(-)
MLDSKDFNQASARDMAAKFLQQDKLRKPPSARYDKQRSSEATMQMSVPPTPTTLLSQGPMLAGESNWVNSGSVMASATTNNIHDDDISVNVPVGMGAQS